MHTLRLLFCEFNNIFDRVIPQVTFLGWKMNLRCDDWNGKDLAAGSCGQQTLLAKKHGETIFWSTSIPNFKKGITIILIRQS